MSAECTYDMMCLCTQYGRSSVCSLCGEHKCYFGNDFSVIVCNWVELLCCALFKQPIPSMAITRKLMFLPVAAFFCVSRLWRAGTVGVLKGQRFSYCSRRDSGFLYLHCGGSDRCDGNGHAAGLAIYDNIRGNLFLMLSSGCWMRVCGSEYNWAWGGDSVDQVLSIAPISIPLYHSSQV